MTMPSSGAPQHQGQPHDWLERASHLSDFDREVIRVLQQDGRISYARIADELSRTEKQVRRRVHELRESGIIKITTVANPEVMGYEALCLLGITIDPACGISKTTSQIAALSGAYYVASVTGRYNVIAEISAVDMDQLLRILDDELSGVPGIRSVETNVYLSPPYQHPAFGAARYKKSSAGEAVQQATAIDSVDRKIISHLHADGRVAYQAIARELAISESQVRLRVKRLVTSNAVKIMALTSPEVLGFETMAMMGVTVARNISLAQVATAVSEVPSVTYVAISAGQFNLLAEVACENKAQLLALIDEIRLISGVASLESWNYLRLHYRSVSPAAINE